MAVVKNLSKGLDLSISVIKETINFHKSHFWDLFKYFIISFLIAFVGILLLGAAIFGISLLVSSLLPVLDFWVSTIIFSLLGLLSLLVGIFILGASQGVNFSALQFILKKKKIPYLDSKNRELGILYTIFTGAVVSLIFLIMFFPFILGLLPGADPSIFLFLGIFSLYISIGFGILLIWLFGALNFYTQFEIAFNKLNPLKGFKNSITLLRNRFWETLAFWFVFYIISQILSLLVSFVTAPVSMFSAVFSIAPIIGFIVIVIVMLLVVLVSFAVSTLLAPIPVFFWREVTKPKEKK
ncbi:hypothetical protein KAW38_04300 [Candidatus Micrarchaeota archaeon]|nr:hypothetical protein [Candidatus Micrarchaeota archaeon]